MGKKTVVGRLVQVTVVEGMGKVRFGYDREWEEYRVQAWDVSGDIVAEYHSAHKDDALFTAERMLADLAGPRPDQVAAVAAFARLHGPDWKDALSQAWWDGSDCREPDGHLLRQVRNQYGPAWLESVEVGSLVARAVASGLLDKEA